MKRSEMIDLLENTWDEYSVCPDIDGRQLLNIIEKAGMLPPPTKEQRQSINNTIKFGTDRSKTSGALLRRIIWEPEGEA